MYNYLSHSLIICSTPDLQRALGEKAAMPIRYLYNVHGAQNLGLPPKKSKLYALVSFNARIDF